MNKTNKITSETKPMFSDYCNDGLIDYRVAMFSSEPIAIFANADGESKTVRVDDNQFAPVYLVRAYKELFKDDYSDNKNDYIRAFCDYLIETGCDPEELED